jgi:hypothetical protein
MMLFKALLTTLPLIAHCASSDTTSTEIGAIVVTPLDYSLYSDMIDYQLLRYTASGDVVFFDKNTTATNNTSPVKSAALLSTGQFQVDASTQKYYFSVNDRGLLGVTTDSSKLDGIFYIDSKTLFYNYHSTFVACELESGQYSLLWRESGASCDSENRLLVKLQSYGSSSGAVSQYYPNNYVSSIASTATEDVYTTTVGAPSTTSKASSTNGAAKLRAVGVVGAAMLLL